MWIVYILLFIFGLTILECVSDLIHFEKWLMDNDVDFKEIESEGKNGKHN